MRVVKGGRLALTDGGRKLPSHLSTSSAVEGDPVHVADWKAAHTNFLGDPVHVADWKAAHTNFLEKGRRRVCAELVLFELGVFCVLCGSVYMEGVNCSLNT